MSQLFNSIHLGNLKLKNRIVMAPLTRCRADEHRVPTELMAEYYAQRAGAGLIISEATSVCAEGYGYPHTPGIHTGEQVAGWKQVVDAVHRQGGLMVLQLWHVGRISHSVFQPGAVLPVAPSAIKPAGKVFTGQKMVEYETPRALETDEISGLIESYRQGALLAKEAGFDGVEIHNANGYLLDQFLRSKTNHRTDRYGGSVLNRCRLTLEVTEAVLSVWSSGCVGIRFSPGGVFNDMADENPLETFSTVLRELNRFNLAYAHITEVTAQDVAHGAATGIGPKELRTYVKSHVITAGGFDKVKAETYLKEGWADAVAFGVPFISNPDLPERFRSNYPLQKADERTFYSSGAKGYTDYATYAP